MIQAADPHGNLWPTPAQEIMLKVALNRYGRALEHYSAWRDMIDLDAKFDRWSYRLLPLLYDTMSCLGLHDSLMGRLKGAYRQAWCETQPRLRRAAEILHSLHSDGIETLVTKGLPLGISVYDNPTVRPMSDLSRTSRNQTGNTNPRFCARFLDVQPIYVLANVLGLTKKMCLTHWV